MTQNQQVDSRAYIALIVLSIGVALAVRAFHHHHNLMSDEANNMLTIKALIEGDGVRNYFFKHPPLFILFASLLVYPVGDNLDIVQYVSIIFSCISLIPAYLIAEKVFDRKVALLSVFFLAFMPLNIIYSTWVKQEAMLLFFFLWSIYFYISGKPVVGGILFGLASLTKEFAWALIPVVVGWELLERKGGSHRRFLQWLVTGMVLSLWWYLLFGRSSFEAITDAAVGGNLFEYAWHFPWYYYFFKIKEDLGLALLTLFLFGLLSTRDRRKGLPLVWILAFYIPLSLFKVKAPWYNYLASPAIAMVASSGLCMLLDRIRSKGATVFILVAVFIALIIEAYNLDTTRYYARSLMKEKADIQVYSEREYLVTGRNMLKGDYKVAFLSYNPILQYYLGIPDRKMIYLSPQFPAMTMDVIGKLAIEYEIGWFVIDKASVNFVDRNIEYMARLWGSGTEVGNLFIFTTNLSDFQLPEGKSQGVIR